MGGGSFIPGNRPRPYRHVITTHDESSRDALTKETDIRNHKSFDLSDFTLQESMRDIINGSRFSMSQYSGHRDSTEEENERPWKREDSSPDSEQGKPEQRPTPVGFWHSGLKNTRRKVYLEWGKTSERRAPVFVEDVLTFLQH